MLGAGKLNRPRLIRFALESILGQTLIGRTDFDSQDGFDDVPIMPPAAYQAVERLMKLQPRVHDDFSYGFRVSRQIADSVGIKEEIISERISKVEVVECEQLRVEADSWYSLGKCLLNAFSKL